MKWELVAVTAAGILFLLFCLKLGLYARKRHVAEAVAGGSSGWVWAERASFLAGILGTLLTLITALPALAGLFRSTSTPSPSPTPISSATDTTSAPGADIGQPISPSNVKWWVNTFENAPGWRCVDNICKTVGSLRANRNYVFCIRWNGQVSVGESRNHWWMWTDLDTGGQGWVSAYYIKGQGNDQAKDIYGRQIPACT